MDDFKLTMNDLGPFEDEPETETDEEVEQRLEAWLDGLLTEGETYFWEEEEGRKPS